MIFKEFGNQGAPVILLLHGGGLSWWMWKHQIEYLRPRYRVIAPVIDGHGEIFQTTFVSIERCAEQLISFVNTNCARQIFAICGLSIGAQIVVEALARAPGISQNAVIESALVSPLKTVSALTAPLYDLSYGLIKKRWFAQLQAKSLNIPDELFEDYYKDSARMTKESLINIARSNASYTFPPSLRQAITNALIVVGGKELPLMKKSAALLHHALAGSAVKIVDNYTHGELSLRHPDAYVDMIQELFK